MSWPAITDQAAVTNWPLRLALVGATAAVIALVLWALRRGWLARAARQQMTLPDTGAAAGLAGEPAVTGKYVGTTSEGHTLDRLVAAGAVARAQVHVGAAGVLLDRDGAGPLVIPASAIDRVDTTPGMLQRYFGKHGVLAIHWRWAGRDVTSGVWFTAAADQALVRGRIEQLVRTGQEGS